ncbi:MAG: glucose-6-phosphate dehydrogenase, partial [Candidatus Ryanbacteria bacterium]|nr:glucose-6-phosphate dehydrogenase [Candidatus Ryanbacteria bacterium]
MSIDPAKNIPTVFVVFGATGDLMARKIVPALHLLNEQKVLPSMFRVLGVARKPLSNEEFRAHIASILEKQKIDTKDAASFLESFEYAEGHFEVESDYKKIAERLRAIDEKWGVCSNKLFYLAVPPDFFETLARNLSSSGLTDPCSPTEGWTRIIVEKPFGKDLATAERLDTLLGTLYREEQIYRIDHYLAKEMLQNILTFRFSNNLFENSWSNRFIERIDIRVHESVGVEERGMFYESVGALRDVGQNHLLQMLALVTMDRPASFDHGAIRKKRAEILEELKTLSPAEIPEATFRAQYTGYRSITGVSDISDVETYFKIRAFLRAPAWRSVPIFIESGKRLGPAQKEIIVTFRHTTPCFCPSDGPHHKNTVTFALEPTEAIRVEFWSKKPGFDFGTERRALDFLYRSEQKKTQYVEEYAKLLRDCITGDQTLFLSTEEIKAMWRFTDPIIEAWRKNAVPLASYAPDTTTIALDAARVERWSENIAGMERTIGIVGLGKMGKNIALRLAEKGWHVVAHDPAFTGELHGVEIASSLKNLTGKLPSQKNVWVMTPAGKATEDVMLGTGGLAGLLKKGDTIIDGGNSLYKDSKRRAADLAKLGIEFLDIGTSGGPAGARNGASLMIGGTREAFDRLEGLFQDLAVGGGYIYAGGA